MFISTAKAAVLLSWTAGALTQKLATCDGLRQPDWDDCAIVAAKFKDKAGEVENFYPGCTDLPNGPDGDTLNCKITVCQASAETQVLYGELRIGYSTVEAVCKSYGAGGEDIYDDRFTVMVYENPNYDPALKSMLDANVDRRHARDFVTKRQAEGDDGFNLIVTQQNVRFPGSEQAVTGRLTAGSSYTTEEATSVTTGVSASVEISAGFFAIFEASIGAEISQDQTSTSSVGIDVLVDCDPGQEGIIIWYPLFTLYQGEFTPSGTNVDIYIPNNSATGTSNFGVRCVD